MKKPEDLPEDLRGLLGSIAWWLRKSLNGWQPPEHLVSTAKWAARALGDLSEGKQAQWPDDPWAYKPPEDP